jgi:hypothetical protein
MHFKSLRDHLTAMFTVFLLIEYATMSFEHCLWLDEVFRPILPTYTWMKKTSMFYFLNSSSTTSLWLLMVRSSNSLLEFPWVWIVPLCKGTCICIHKRWNLLKRKKKNILLWPSIWHYDISKMFYLLFYHGYYILPRSKESSVHYFETHARLLENWWISLYTSRVNLLSWYVKTTMCLLISHRGSRFCPCISHWTYAFISL